MQKRASQVLIHQKRASQVLIYQKNVQKRAKTCKNVHLKYFWTQFKNVHLRGPCSLRPCILRPYCSPDTKTAKDLNGLGLKPHNLLNTAENLVADALHRRGD